jgi:OmpA-OmpF porin, OOP family
MKRKFMSLLLVSSISVCLSFGQNDQDFKTYSNYDFVPGSKVIFFDDFSQGSIGDFPSMWNSNASGEIIKTNIFEGKWFKMNTDGNFFLNDGLNTAENFTIEYDVFLTTESGSGDVIRLTIMGTEEDDMFPNPLGAGLFGIDIEFATVDSGVGEFSFRSFDNDKNTSFSGKYSKEEDLFKFNKLYRISIWVQKTRLRLYVDQKKVFDVQRAFPANSKVNQLRFTTFYECAVNISNFRIANAMEDNRSKLLTEGKIISYGIYFNVGKDVVKPESYGSIKEIAGILKDNPEVKVQIVGHTDSDGNAASNKDLSVRRAANVKNVLVKEFGISADRLETAGKGQEEPIAPNTSSENKAKNRRVEFIKL